jgi:hypothetical protein
MHMIDVLPTDQLANTHGRRTQKRTVASGLSKVSHETSTCCVTTYILALHATTTIKLKLALARKAYPADLGERVEGKLSSHVI